jgi:hypothetical protein
VILYVVLDGFLLLTYMLVFDLFVPAVCSGTSSHSSKNR